MPFSSRFLAVFVVSVFLLSCAPVSQGVAQEQTPPPQKALADLWIDLSMGKPLVDWFNKTARPDDIARVEHPSLIGVLDEITTGQRLVVFKSAADARAAMPLLADRMDILGYNLEHGPANPADEQADPVAGVKAMQELARQYGLKLAMGPDHDFAVQYGAALAPYVDMFVLQVQRVQTDPETVRAFVVPLAEELRKANPEIQISVQVRTEGDVEQIADLLESMLPSIDGVSILTSPETVDIAKDLVRELRSRTVPPVLPTPAKDSISMQELVPSALAAELTTPTVEARTSGRAGATRVATTPEPLPAVAAPQNAEGGGVNQPTVAPVVALSTAAPVVSPGSLQRFLLPLAGLMTLVAIVGGVVGALVVLFYRHKQ